MVENYNKQLQRMLGSGNYGMYTQDQKNKRKPINKTLRDLVWIKYMGNKTEGKCYCCKIRPIHFTDFQVGHNKAVAKSGKNHISNLRPICSGCNSGMRTKSIEAYRKKNFAKPIKKKTTKKKIKRRKVSSSYGENYSKRFQRILGT